MITGERPARHVLPPSRRRGTAAGWRRRIGVLVGAMVLVVLLGGAGLWALTPAVGDVQQRVSAFAAQHHATVLIGAVPSKYATALIATEDSRFYSHHGVDSRGVARAAWGFVGEKDRGGSTLDQQLAKELYSNGQHSPADVITQVVLGVKLDASYSKAQILGMYAQVAYFGHGFYGLPDAACGYFNTPPGALSWSQASLLAGLPQAPSDYDPFQAPKLAAQRQHHVLDRLVVVGALTQAQADRITPSTWHLTTGSGGAAAPGCGG